MWLLSVVGLLLGASGTAGCKKQAAEPPKKLEDTLAQLRVAFVKASPDVKSILNSQVEEGIRFGNYPQALAGLDRLGTQPSLSTKQKKLVSEVTELVKAKMQGGSNAAQPAP